MRGMIRGFATDSGSGIDADRVALDQPLEVGLDDLDAAVRLVLHHPVEVLEPEVLAVEDEVHADRPARPDGPGKWRSRIRATCSPKASGSRGIRAMWYSPRVSAPSHDGHTLTSSASGRNGCSRFQPPDRDSAAGRLYRSGVMRKSGFWSTVPPPAFPSGGLAYRVACADPTCNIRDDLHRSGMTRRASHPLVVIAGPCVLEDARDQPR